MKAQLDLALDHVERIEMNPNSPLNEERLCLAIRALVGGLRSLASAPHKVPNPFWRAGFVSTVGHSNECHNLRDDDHCLSTCPVYREWAAQHGSDE